MMATTAIAPRESRRHFSTKTRYSTVHVARRVTGVARRCLRLSLASSLALLALACNESTPVDAEPPGPTEPFAITPLGAHTLHVPRTLQLSTKGGSESGPVSWESSDDAIVSVGDVGLVTARYPGSVTITARRGSAEATTTVSAAAYRFEVEPNEVALDRDSTTRLTATARDADGTVLSGVPVSWSSRDASIAVVNATSGVVTAIAAGATFITATGAGMSAVATVRVDTPVAAPLVLSSIGSIGNHLCALERVTGIAYCWGDGHAGALGIGDRVGGDVPVPVSGTQRFSSLSVGSYATCGVETQTGSIYCWGRNEFGDLGDGTFQTRWEPTSIASPIRFRSVSASGALTCGIEAHTELAYCWGKGGLVGDGTLSNRSTPTLVGNGAVRFDSVSVSLGHACGLEAETGVAYCWGSNAHGQVGDGTTTDRLVPVIVGGGTRRFSSISAGSVSCGIEKETGFAYCWGANAHGQVGDGTRTDRLAPVLVGEGSTRFRSISATGWASVCAIQSQTDLVYCWGSYVALSEGGATVDEVLPTLVAGGSTRFSSIAAAFTGFCGVEAETGLGYCWDVSRPVVTPIPLR